MKNIINLILLSLTCVTFSQEKVLDTLEGKKQNLDEVIVESIRVKYSSPISHSNISKVELKSRNLGQDLPVLLNFLPSIVTTSDAGAGIGYTGIRIRGVSAQSTNITINGIPFNDTEYEQCFDVTIGEPKALKSNYKTNSRSRWRWD